MARGVDGREIFRDDHDRRAFLRTLDRVKTDSRASLLAYCLMDNHFHLAIKIQQVPLAVVLQRILTSHALSFNQKYERTGHLFQARYKALICHEQSYLISLIRYIHMNPVRAGLTTAPELWPWSSYAEYRRNGRDGLIDSEFDIPDLEAPPPDDFSAWPATEERTPQLLRTEITPDQNIEALARGCLNGSGVTLTCLRSKTRRREITRLKRLLIQRGMASGFTLTTIADWLGLSLSSAHHYVENK